MKIAIMQPYFFPYMGYFSLIESVDKFILFDDVNYIKRGWINRNYFLGKSGSFRYTLPLIKASQNNKINCIKINEPEANSAQFLYKLKHSYHGAPYFDDVYSLISNTMPTSNDKLSSFLAKSLERISEYIGLDAEFSLSSELKYDRALPAQEKIISICKSLGANVYVNAIGGRELYFDESFRSEKIELKFLNFKATAYQQFKGQFIPNLSIVDSLMFNSPKTVLSQIKQYELING